jgi:hypothetical protein
MVLLGEIQNCGAEKHALVVRVRYHKENSGGVFYVLSEPDYFPSGYGKVEEYAY